MGRAIGIDLGTTNSVAAFRLADVEVVTADDNTPPERKLTRSVVALNQGKLLVGESAYNQLRGDAKNVVASIKRLIGRGLNDPSIQDVLPKFKNKIQKASDGTDNSLAIILGDKEYQPEDISAEILKKIVANTQTYLEKNGKGDSDVTHAVITVPAYFNDKQRHATQVAAQRANLGVLELLAEPTAAAISYGFQPGSDDVKTILVYDFGGGTFDASMITASGDHFVEQGKAGDLWLGGDDIDEVIIRFVKQEVARAEAIDDMEAMIAAMPEFDRNRFLGDLKATAERAKIELSSADSTRIIPSSPLKDEMGMIVPVDVELTREKFESLITPLIDRTVAISRQAMADVDYGLDLIDVVLLVGGSSQIPLVLRRMREAFGDKVLVHPRPMFAVAEGAAIVAAGLVEKVLTVSRDYFIKLENGDQSVLERIIPRNELLPFKTSQTFKTVSDGQRLICLELFNGDWVKGEATESTTESIGKMWLALNDFHPKGTEVTTFIELDEANNLLQITAALKNDPGVKVSRSFSRGKSDEVVYDRLDELIRELNGRGYPAGAVEEGMKLAADVVQDANRMLDERTGQELSDRRRNAEQKLSKLEQYISEDRDFAEFHVAEFKMLTDLCGFLLPEEQAARMNLLTKQLQDALDRNDLSALQALNEEATEELGDLPPLVSMFSAGWSAGRRAYAVNTSEGSAIFNRLQRFLQALRSGDTAEADRIWTEARPDILRWLDRELPSAVISTGITK